MKRGRWTDIAAVALLCVVLGSVGLFVWLQPNISFCKRGADINDRELAEISEASLAFLALLNDGETTRALEAMSADGRAATERMTMISAIEFLNADQAAAPIVRDAFSLKVYGGQRGFATCASATHRPTLVARGGGVHTAFVLVSEQLSGAERTSTFWLVREGGAWRVRAFHVGLSAIAGRDGAALWRMADEQRVRGNHFNATLLYDVAGMALHRGGWLQHGDAHGFRHAHARLQRHRELPPERPYVFSLGGQEFDVAYIQITGVGENTLVLALEQGAETPDDIPGAIAANRAFIDAMDRFRPEWRDAFDALVSAYPIGGSQVWRTVFEKNGGYTGGAEPEEPSSYPSPPLPAGHRRGRFRRASGRAHPPRKCRAFRRGASARAPRA